MVKINFTEFWLVTDLDGKHVQKANVKEVVADAVYKKASGIKALALAMKIHNGDGEQEYDDDEAKILGNVIEGGLNAMFLRSYNRTIGKEG